MQHAWQACCPGLAARSLISEFCPVGELPPPYLGTLASHLGRLNPPHLCLSLVHLCLHQRSRTTDRRLAHWGWATPLLLALLITGTVAWLRRVIDYVFNPTCLIDTGMGPCYSYRDACLARSRSARGKIGSLLMLRSSVESVNSAIAQALS